VFVSTGHRDLHHTARFPLRTSNGDFPRGPEMTNISSLVKSLSVRKGLTSMFPLGFCIKSIKYISDTHYKSKGLCLCSGILSCWRQKVLLWGSYLLWHLVARNP